MVLLVSPIFCLADMNGLEKIFYMSQSQEKEGILSLQKNADKIDILAPQFFSVSSKMKIVGKFDSQLEQLISQKKIKVMPLVTNAGFSQSTIHDLLTSSPDQDAVIKGLVYIAK